MSEELRENKMGTMPVRRLVLSMSLPMMIAMLVQALYNVVDSYFVAKLSENALTAVGMVFPFQNLMIAVGVGTGVGEMCIRDSPSPAQAGLPRQRARLQRSAGERAGQRLRGRRRLRPGLPGSAGGSREPEAIRQEKITV